MYVLYFAAKVIASALPPEPARSRATVDSLAVTIDLKSVFFAPAFQVRINE